MNNFAKRHIGPSSAGRTAMLDKIGAKSIEELIKKTIPENIRMAAPLEISKALSEKEYLEHIGTLAAQNKVYQSYIGLGYSETIVPPVIQRNVLENPGWYTAYTPYQAEISQGRLEALLNFQTMVIDLTGMEIANASLLDEATAAAEAMIMFFNARSREAKKEGKNQFFVSQFCYPQTIDVVIGKAKNLGIELVIDDPYEYNFDQGNFFGALFQYPDALGRIRSIENVVSACHKNDVKVALAADIMALVVLESPGKMGVDVVCGSTQRFGVPMGYGGPHAAFFATKEEYKRFLPGRIIGVSKDADGHPAYRMALQTREQHIKRAKATSNICTAQALLAVMAGMYAVYHGAEGLAEIANTIHNHAATIQVAAEKAGYKILNSTYFDTLWLETPEGVSCKEVEKEAEKVAINLRYIDEQQFSISVGEGLESEDILRLVNALENAAGLAQSTTIEITASKLPQNVARKTAILTHEVFNTHRSETQMMRYLKKLENKDLSLVHSMIPLGSCTMKLNAAAELMPITWPEFANIHPFAPMHQVEGYQKMVAELKKDLFTITGFDAMSLQPNSGAQGEYAGLMVIKAYHEARGDEHRTVCLIPASAHGTNPASAVMAGFEVVVTKCDEQGNIDIADLKLNAEKYADTLGALMVTYPSTHGVFEAGIKEIMDIIHENGGQVYMDGANMNAQVGFTNPGLIGADVCHLNLHKTFAIPHGGGGPGMGPIGVAKHLTPFLPGNPFVQEGGDKAIHAISAAPYGSALILLISYGYIKMLGAKGLQEATALAITNANYLKAVLKEHYPILYSGQNDTVAHELIVDCREFKKSANIEVADIAKRLIDYGFHAPTVSFPVHGTLMIEPTESEDKAELDRFCEAMISIRKEIKAIEEGKADKADNVLKNAPHTAACLINQAWEHKYAPKEAAYPLPYLLQNKYWAPVRRIDDAFGDRNLICSCPAVSEYEKEPAII